MRHSGEDGRRSEAGTIIINTSSVFAKKILIYTRNFLFVAVKISGISSRSACGFSVRSAENRPCDFYTTSPGGSEALVPSGRTGIVVALLLGPYAQAPVCEEGVGRLAQFGGHSAGRRLAQFGGRSAGRRLAQFGGRSAGRRLSSEGTVQDVGWLSSEGAVQDVGVWGIYGNVVVETSLVCIQLSVQILC